MRAAIRSGARRSWKRTCNWRGDPITFHATVFTTSTTQGGYVVGIGAETAFAPRWTAGLEYLYIDTGNFTLFSGPVPSSVLAIFGAGGGATATINDSARMQNNIVRARLNYRFQ